MADIVIRNPNHFNGAPTVVESGQYADMLRVAYKYETDIQTVEIVLRERYTREQEDKNTEYWSISR